MPLARVWITDVPAIELVAERGVEGDEPHDTLGHRSDLAEVGVRRVHFRVPIVLAVEQVLEIHAELERTAGAQIERARDVRVNVGHVEAANAVDPEREDPLLEAGW